MVQRPLRSKLVVGDGVKDRKCSSSFIQRKLSIGYGQAKREVLVPER